MLGYDLLVVRGPGEKVEKVSRKSRVDSERSNEGLNPGPIKSTKTSCPTGFENERIEHICSRKTTQSSGTQNRDSTESLKQKKVWKKASWTRGAFSHSTKKTCEIDDENKRIVTRLLAATSKTSSVNAAKEHDLVRDS